MSDGERRETFSARNYAANSPRTTARNSSALNQVRSGSPTDPSVADKQIADLPVKHELDS
jgi:hypothetical protein